MSYKYSRQQMFHINDFIYNDLKRISEKNNGTLNLSSLLDISYYIIAHLRTENKNIMLGSEDLNKIHLVVKNAVNKCRERKEECIVKVGILNGIYSYFYIEFENEYFNYLKELENKLI